MATILRSPCSAYATSCSSCWCTTSTSCRWRSRCSSAAPGWCAPDASATSSRTQVFRACRGWRGSGRGVRHGHVVRPQAIAAACPWRVPGARVRLPRNHRVDAGAACDARFVAWLAPVGAGVEQLLLQSLLASTIFYGYGRNVGTDRARQPGAAGGRDLRSAVVAQPLVAVRYRSPGEGCALGTMANGLRCATHDGRSTLIL